MPETLTVTGVCKEISERSGWQTFHIDSGGQWPTKLATKKESVIADARGAGSELAVWTYTEVESDRINEHTGKPYVNKYLESVEVGGTAAPSETPRPQAQAASSTTTHTPYAQGDKDRAITRMAVLKAAAEVCASMEFAPGEDIGSEVISLAHRFEVWVNRDIDEIPFG